MRKVLSLILLCFMLATIGCRQDTTAEEEKTYNIMNAQYDSHSECVMDIYRKDDSVKPVAMLIHGGAWIKISAQANESLKSFGQGDINARLGRSGMTGFKDLFLDNGYHVANIDYRLIDITAPDSTDDSVTFPSYKDMIDDVKKAVSYLKDNAAKYGIDTSKIVMYGYSAGGHLAELYSYSVDDSPIPVSLCVGRAGPSDFMILAKSFTENQNGFFDSLTAGFPQNPNINTNAIIRSLLAVPNDVTDDAISDYILTRLSKRLLGIDTDARSLANLAADKDFMTAASDASPINHTKANSPETILIHGKNDTTVPFESSESLAEQLDKLGVAYTFIQLEYSGHSLDDPRDKSNIEEFNKAVIEAITK